MLDPLSHVFEKLVDSVFGPIVGRVRRMSWLSRAGILIASASCVGRVAQVSAITITPSVLAFAEGTERGAPLLAIFEKWGAGQLRAEWFSDVRFVMVRTL